MFTIDASVWLNSDSPAEPHYADSRALLDRVATANVLVIVPTLLLAEVAGVISRTRGSPTLADAYVTAMRQLTFIRWEPLDETLAIQAAALASARALRGADSVYAAVALAQNWDLISLDREHLTRLPGVVRTMTPHDALAAWRA